MTVSPTTEAALRELLAKAIDATVTGDRPRALAALNEMHGLFTERGGTRASSKSPAKRHRCRDCTLAFKWPGELADHRRRQHGEIDP